MCTAAAYAEVEPQWITKPLQDEKRTVLVAINYFYGEDVDYLYSELRQPDGVVYFGAAPANLKCLVIPRNLPEQETFKRVVEYVRSIIHLSSHPLHPAQ